MVREILKDIYSITVPLPGFPLRDANAYLIRGKERSLLIDPGAAREQCATVMRSALEQLGVPVCNLDIFITHLHADHAGLVNSLLAERTSVYFNALEDSNMYEEQGCKPLMELTVTHGFPSRYLDGVMENIKDRGFDPIAACNIRFIKDQDVLEVGDYSLECVLTQGHSSGHTCLYERNSKLFFAGDHILSGITPYLYCGSDSANPLRDYIDNLHKTACMDIATVLPGHFSIISDHRRTIGKLKRHHEARINEVMTVISSSPATAYETAAQIRWNLGAKQWDDFHVMAKWITTMETLAYLRFLEDQGRIKRQWIGKLVRYSS